MSDMQPKAHPDRVVQALQAGEAALSPLVASWSRSARLHGLDPSAKYLPTRMTEAEFRQAHERSEPLLRIAEPTLDRLFKLVQGFGGCVMLADADGVPVDRRGRAGDDQDFEDCGLWTGTIWTEAQAGTNGIGTCIADGRGVTIHKDQHFLASNIGLSCTSAPIHDSQGQLTAVLDVSSASESLTRDVARLVSQSTAEAARRIEADYFRASFPGARFLLAPGVERGQGALLAVDADELVVGATRAARKHLGLSGDLSANPVPAADLLGFDAHESAEEAERAVLLRALSRAGGNVSAAARALGISRATFHRKLGPRA
ncbi:GAF domain-containing protein [Nioella aestuarii]|uniref:GAF domain-containing protein n=1 Tax=Nioella aestuarii TaxID=1662864 RepID=UPI003D7F24A2